MARLRWGLLSTARINRALITPLRASPRNVLTAVASRTPEQAQAYAKEWGIGRAHGSYEALLDDPEIDVIYNPLPNSLHAEWTIRACEAGKHVLCEKPLACTAAEVEAMAAAAQAAGVVVAEAFMYRHHPQTLRVRELVTSGALGPVRLVRGSFSFLLKNPGDVRLDAALGGGAVWDIGCYPVSYARSLLGAEPLEVFAQQVTGPSGVDLTLTGELRFPGEVLVQVDCSFQAPFRSVVEVVGGEAVLTIPQPFKPGRGEQVLLQRGEQVERIDMPGQDLYLGEVEDMADAILLGRPPRISLEDSLANVRALVALLESAKLGRPVAVGQ